MNDQMGEARGVSTMRLYGASVALVSGGYSLYQATTGMAMSGMGASGSAWFMAALGVVVLVHGAVLLTPAVAALGRASGPLMVGYAVLMLLNQAWLATAGGGMAADGTMNGGMQSGMDTAMGADAGMVAIAVLMLASGVIMTQRSEML
jgi:hypothetical protein